MAVQTRQQLNVVKKDNVFLYYPNIIGYLRVILMMVSFYTAQTSYITTFCCYFLSFFGDVVDGYVARRFNQCSTFGAIFDMITDRVATCGLLVVLSNCYPAYSIAFISLIALDIYSHWLHVERYVRCRHSNILNPLIILISKNNNHNYHL